MKNLKRKTRSDKFPLTFHPTGQYCKKIKGKIHYCDMSCFWRKDDFQVVNKPLSRDDCSLTVAKKKRKSYNFLDIRA